MVGSRENLVAEKRCLKSHPTPSEATYRTAEQQNRQQLRHCSRFGSNLWLILLRCARCAASTGTARARTVPTEEVAGRLTSPCSRGCQRVPNAPMLILPTDSGSGHPSCSSYHRGRYWLCLLAPTAPPTDLVCRHVGPCQAIWWKNGHTPAVFMYFDCSLALSAALCGVLHKPARPEHAHFAQQR